MILLPRSPSLSTCMCVCVCVWIQVKISILPAGPKNPGLPPLHWDTASEEVGWLWPLMWKCKQRKISISHETAVCKITWSTSVSTCNSHSFVVLYVLAIHFAKMFTCLTWHNFPFTHDLIIMFAALTWILSQNFEQETDPAKDSQNCLQQQQQAVDTLTANLPWWPRKWTVKVDISPHVQALCETSTLQRKRGLPHVEAVQHTYRIINITWYPPYLVDRLEESHDPTVLQVTCHMTTVCKLHVTNSAIHVQVG